jgi:hypothetical protein
VGEVYEDEIVLDGWKTSDGKPVQLASLACESSQLISATPVDDWTPTRQDYEGYTGNAGNTLDRWYHKSAIAIWPDDQHFEIITQMSLEFAIDQLLEMRTELPQLDEDLLEQACDDCQRLAEAIIHHWPNRVHDHRYGDQDRQPWLHAFTLELPKFDDPQLVGDLLRTVAARDWHLQLDRLVVTSLRRMGPAAILPLLRDLLQFDPPPNPYGRRFLEGLPERDASWLLKLTSDRQQTGLSVNEIEALLTIAAKKLSDHAVRLESEDSHRADAPTSAWLMLCKAVIAWADGEQRDELLRSLLSLPSRCPGVFELRKIQVPSATKLCEFSLKRHDELPPALASWTAELRRTLQDATTVEPQPPPDFRRRSETGCDCPYCRQLSEFLQHPHLETTQIAARADRRDHLEQVIHHHRLDVRATLVRAGSPYSLELTKTNASYDKDLKRYRSDLKLLESLQR